MLLVEVLLCVNRNRRFTRDGSPGRPPRLSHSSWALSVWSQTWTYIYWVGPWSQLPRRWAHSTLKCGQDPARSEISHMTLKPLAPTTFPPEFLSANHYGTARAGADSEIVRVL